MKKKVQIILSNIKELVCISQEGTPLYGSTMNNISKFTNYAVAIADGLIEDLAPTSEILTNYDAEFVIDCTNKVVTPGFVDAHTHPVFVETRENEFEMRILGKSYVEIAQSGGGILSTVQTTRKASSEQLFHLAKSRILRMLKLGTTTLEAKSGYGLSTESELKLLEVIYDLSQQLPVDIIPTFMGAHEFPPEFRQDRAGYVELLCNEMLPAIAQQGIAEFCDIFCEAHVFNIEQSRKILLKAKELGFKLKIHADEIESVGGAELASELGCISADHLGMTSLQGIYAMKEANVIPVLLPATLFSLGKNNYAKAVDMIAAELPVALSTDFNPGSCNCDSMPFVMTLACLQMKMTPAQVLAASTINAAAAIDRADKIGSISRGKQADLLIWDIPSYKFIPFHIGSSHLETIIKKGNIIKPDEISFE